MITSGYGWRVHPVTGALTFHRGVDFALPVGSPLVAPLAGRVSLGESPTAGLWVSIRGELAGRRVEARLLHLSQARSVSFVAEGELIAWSGASGRVTGPHLHYEVWIDGAPVDPALLMRP